MRPPAAVFGDRFSGPEFSAVIELYSEASPGPGAFLIMHTESSSIVFRNRQPFSRFFENRDTVSSALLKPDTNFDSHGMKGWPHA